MFVSGRTAAVLHLFLALDAFERSEMSLGTSNAGLALLLDPQNPLVVRLVQSVEAGTLTPSVTEGLCGVPYFDMGGPPRDPSDIASRHPREPAR